MTKSLTPAADKIEAPRPYWVPPGVDLDELPAGLKAAILGIVNPAYELLVLQAQPGLEASTGLTITYVLWREILAQVSAPQPLGGAEEEPERDQLDAELARYLRIAGAKERVSRFYLKLQEYRRKWGALPDSRDPLRGSLSKMPAPQADLGQDGPENVQHQNEEMQEHGKSPNG